MAEVTKNVPEQKTCTSSADTSKSKSTSSNSLKQSKIGFLPRKKVIPSFVKADSATAEKKPHDSNTNDTSKNSSEKTPVKKASKPDIVKPLSSSKSGKPEENGGIKQNGKSSTPSKKSSDSEKDDLPLVKLKHASEKDDLPLVKLRRDSEKDDLPLGKLKHDSEKDDIPLVKLKHDKSKCNDSPKSSKPKTPKKDSGADKHGKHESKSKSSTPVKKSTTPVKKPSSTSKKTSEQINDKKDSSSGKTLPNSSSSSSSGKKPIENNSSVVTSTVQVPTGNQSSKGRLSSSVKGQRSCPVEITSSDDEDDEMPLSQIRKKCTPVKSDSASSGSLNKTDKGSAVGNKNSTPMNILMANQRPKTTQKTGKLDQTVQALHNRQVNGPIHNAMKNMTGASGKPTPPPLHPVPTKNIIIAIDMDPQKWKSLSPQEQTRIIEHKKELARKHLIAQSKAPSNQSRLIPQNHRHMAPQVMNVHHKLPPHMVASNAYPNKSNLIISPTHPNAKPYSVNVAAARPTIPHNPYYGPRTPNFPSQMSPRIGPHVGPHIGPMQQSQQFSNFNFKQFNVKQEESTMTDLKPLPLTKKIPMPPGFPNDYFGDIAMIVEFVNTFKKFLMYTAPLDAVSLMIGVSPGSDKADIVANILLMFLKVLLSNEDYKVRGLKMELADLPLTEFTVSFLVCQLIKSQLETKKRQRKEKEFAEKAAKAAEKVADLIPAKEPNAEDSDSDADFDAADVALYINSDSDDDNGEKKKKKKKKDDTDRLETELTIISKQLESKEFWQLDTVNQIRVLTFLIDLILDSGDITDYYDEIAEEKSKFYRGIEEQRKKKAKLKMENAVVTLDQFTKKMPNDKASAKEEKDKSKNKEEDKDKEKNGDSEKDKEEDKDKKEPEKPPDPYAGMTQRQREAIRSEIERNEEKKREREWQEAELARIDYEKSTAKFTGIVALLKRCMRVEPLGEDRFHRLYWFFTDGIPGLYVSNCCVGTIVSNPLGGERPKESWSYYNKEEDINQLLCALTVRGIREEKLKSRIRDEHLAISASIKEIKEIDMYKMIRRSQNIDKPEEVKKVNDTVEKPKTEEKASAAGMENKPEADGKKDEKMEVDGEKVEKNKVGENKDGKILDDHKVDGDTKNVDGNEVDSKQKENDAEKKISVDKEIKMESDEKKHEHDGNLKSEVSEEKKALADSDKVVDANKKEQDGTAEKKTLESEDKDSTKKMDNKTDSEKKKETDEDDDEKIINLIDKNVEDDKPYDAHKASIEALKADIIESANRIVHGSLGELTDLDLWTERVSSVNTVEGLKEFVLQIQSCIVPKFFLTPFKATAIDISKDWCNWVERCMTLSTMHMLYGLLENSIKWESSSEKMRCKVCRRRKGVEQIQQIIVCDGCHLGYHSHCLRPPLNYIPEGIWKCPSCAPKGEAPSGKSGRSARAAKQGKEVVSSEEEGDEEKESGEEETDHEEVCHECESDGTLILCDTCPLSFHLECHKPPLHHAPRGNWSCYECTSSRSRRGGRNNSKNKKATGKQGREARSKYVDYSDDYDMESENEASSSDEFVSAKKGKKAPQSRPKKNASAKKNPPRKRRAVRNMEESTEDDGSEYGDNDSSSESSQDDAPKGRRAKKTASAKIIADNKPTKSRRKKNLASEAEEDEDKSTRPSRGRKKKRVLSDEEEEDDNDVITSENLSEKIQKFNYKKRGSKTTQNDEENNNSKTKKTNLRKKGRKRTKLDNGEDENSSNNSNSGGEEWEITHISPTLGNKRPCYAKDGLNKKEKEANEKKQKASTDSSPEKSGDEEGKKDAEKNGDEALLDSDKVDDGQENEPDDEKSEDAKKQEVLRNLSSADRSFRQAGRNSRRCNYEMQACRNILASLRKHKDAWAFLLPVNVKQAPDYLTIIEKPMDFSLVLKNLDDFLYDDALQFVDDVKLVFENSKKYNSDTSVVGEAGVRLNEEFQELLKIHLPEVHATLQT